MVQICQFGAGRIGQIHAANVAGHPKSKLRYVVDIDGAAAHSLAEEHGAQVTDVETALGDTEVDAVVIASSTDTHADLIEASARAGKAVFCEKPVDLSLERVDRCLAEVERLGVPLMIGFNRRFDPSFAALHQALRDGRVGKVELVQITSRDPGPPPIEYVKVSGGLFRDMMIHDFDMARWLLGADPVEVFASASCLVEPEIGAVGDVDTAVVTLRTAGGALAVITNSRRATYGYDQRIEALGSEGMVQAGNRRPTTVETSTAEAVSRDTPLYLFLERYAEAYRAELDTFIECLAQGTVPDVGARDGRMALVLAEAAVESWESGAPAPVKG
jgi:myo-inositol 2-dehydrogenase/D-chiro-inositol 1-dehydrogenase